MTPPRLFRRLRSLWAVGTLFLCLATVSCTSGGVATQDSPGDRLLAGGDFAGAVHEYERDLEANPDSLVLQEKLNTAKLRRAHSLVDAALAAAERGDGERARQQLETAERLAPYSPVVRRAQQGLDGALEDARYAADLRAQGEALLSASPEAAQDVLAEARRADPDDVDTVRLLREATLRAEAERAAGRATERWTSGDRAGAIEELRRARFDGRPVTAANALRGRMARELLDESRSTEITAARDAYEMAVAADLARNAVVQLRDRLVARLGTASGALLDAGRPATAAILEIEARRLGADLATPALDSVRVRAQVVIGILPFEDATGGQVDGTRLARSLTQELWTDATGGGLAIRVLPPSSDLERRLSAEPRALTISGVVRSQRIAEGPRAQTSRRVKVQTGVRVQDNPEARRITRELERNETQLARLREDLADSREELRRLKALPFQRGETGRRISAGRARYEMSIARAEARVSNLERREKDLADQTLVGRQKLIATPQKIQVPVFGEKRRPVTEYRKVAELTARVVLRDATHTLFDADITGSTQHDEVVAEALPEASLAADPDDAPDDAEMARRAAQHFASVTAGRVRAAAEEAASAFLRDARAAERAGRSDEAAEGYALYLLTTPEVASPQRADAARALQEISGIHVPVRTGAERRRP